MTYQPSIQTNTHCSHTRVKGFLWRPSLDFNPRTVYFCPCGARLHTLSRSRYSPARSHKSATITHYVCDNVPCLSTHLRLFWRPSFRLPTCVPAFNGGTPAASQSGGNYPYLVTAAMSGNRGSDVYLYHLCVYQWETASGSVSSGLPSLWRCACRMRDSH